MTVYARADIACVSISRLHGGCGSAHTRPAPGGKPVETWGLKCTQGCEDILRKDPLWAATIGELPETYDETVVREDNEKRGKMDAEKRALTVQNNTADALMKLTELLERQGSNSTDVASMAAAMVLALQQAGTTTPVEDSKPSMKEETPADNLADLTYTDLKNVAKAKGLPVERSRAAQLKTLKAHLGE